MDSSTRPVAPMSVPIIPVVELSSGRLWDLTRSYVQAQEEHEVLLIVPEGVTSENLKGFRVIERSKSLATEAG